MTRRLPVTHLAEFVHRRGDLHQRVEGGTRPEEGIAAQRKLQRDKPEGYERERSVRQNVTVAGHQHSLAGRIDGCHVDARIVEEYKTTRGDHDRAYAQYAGVHWAQLELYGALLASELPLPPAPEAARSLPRWTLKLIYVHPDTLATSVWERERSDDELKAFLADTLRWYEAWLVAHFAHLEARNEAIDRLKFPYPDYRAHQRALVQRAYRALRDGEQLLLEAPTGSGKTMGVLYPALKVLSLTPQERIFYLTSRSTGADAALEALQRLDPRHGNLRIVQITARERACAWVNEDCSGDCAFARGYFDRVHDALRDVLGRGMITKAALVEVALAHRVCPFELSLDAAYWSDVIIGDYNYVFDPMVRLQRFAGDDKMVLLIDECHQLSTRARQMLSVELIRDRFHDAQHEDVPAALRRRLAAVDRQLRELARVADLPRDGSEMVVEQPARLLRAALLLVEHIAVSEVDLSAHPHAQAACFDCIRWVRAQAWYDSEYCVHVASRAGAPRGPATPVAVRMAHLDPGAYLAEICDGFAAHVRFSGTASPLSLYQRLHGMGGRPSDRAGSPFSADQLAVCIVDDVPTYYHQRASSLAKLAELIYRVVSARSGHYLVAFPSYAYLASAAEQLGACYPEVRWLAQQPGMDVQSQQQFLQSFDATGQPVVGLVVLGGMFAESVNITGSTGSSLAGVVCVGIGLPPPDVERQALAAYFDAQGESGAAVAYHQPAMSKVLQVAGRLLRGPADKGVLCLVDERFKQPHLQRFFPAHWRPQVLPAASVPMVLDKFWRPGAGSHRLRAGCETSLPANLPEGHDATPHQNHLHHRSGNSELSEAPGNE